MSNKEMEARIVAAFKHHKAAHIGTRPDVKNRLSMECHELMQLLASLTGNNSDQLTRGTTLANYSRVLMRYMNTLDVSGRPVDLSKKNIDWYVDGLISEGNKGLIAKSFLSGQFCAVRALLKHLGREEDARSLRRLKPALQMMTPAKTEKILARRRKRELQGKITKARRSY